MMQVAGALGSRAGPSSRSGLSSNLYSKSGETGTRKLAKSNGTMQILITGRIESGQIENAHEVSCAYEFVTGPDWLAKSGNENGETQNARNLVEPGDRASVVWNFPIDTRYESSNISGWPRISITVRDESRNLVGYGSVYVPTCGGSCVRYVRLFTPLGSTALGHSIAKASSTLPEFYDSRFTTACKGREAARVVSSGVVKIVLTTRVVGKQALGYS